MAKVVDDAGAKSILPHVRTKVLPESVVYTDEAAVYGNLKDMGYEHDWVSHSGELNNEARSPLAGQFKLAQMPGETHECYGFAKF